MTPFCFKFVPSLGWEHVWIINKNQFGCANGLMILWFSISSFFQTRDKSSSKCVILRECAILKRPGLALYHWKMWGFFATPLFQKILFQFSILIFLLSLYFRVTIFMWRRFMCHKFHLSYCFQSIVLQFWADSNRKYSSSCHNLNYKKQQDNKHKLF